MKKMTKPFLTTGLTAFVAMTLLAGSAPAFATSSSPDNVSVIDEAVPATPDEGVSAVGDQSSSPDFPPQPVSVAPAETDANAVSAVGNDSVTPLPNETVPVVPETNVPPQEALTQPSAPAAVTAETSTGVASGGDVMGSTGVKQQHSGQYYDSMALVPNSELNKAGATGPRKVDPLIEPGQKMIIVEKSGSANSFEGQYVAATRALKLGRYAAAMEMFEKLYKKNHRDARILMGLAVAQQGAGFTESAARTYEDLLNVEPNNADAIVNLMGIMQGQYPSITLQRLMALRDKYPSNPGVPAQIGLVNAQMQNYDDAIRYLEIAATMDARNPSHIYNMAIVTDRKGDARNAIKMYERALELDAAYGDTARSLPREEIYDRLSTLRRKV